MQVENIVNWVITLISAIGIIGISVLAIKNHAGFKLHTKYGDIELGDEDEKMQQALKLKEIQLKAWNQAMQLIKQVTFGKILKDCCNRNKKVDFYEMRHKVGEAIINLVEKEVSVLGFQDIASASDNAAQYWFDNLIEEIKNIFLEDKIDFDEKLLTTELQTAMKLGLQIQRNAWAKMHPTLKKENKNVK